MMSLIWSAVIVLGSLSLLTHVFAADELTVELRLVAGDSQSNCDDWFGNTGDEPYFAVKAGTSSYKAVASTRYTGDGCLKRPNGQLVTTFTKDCGEGVSSLNICVLAGDDDGFSWGDSCDGFGANINLGDMACKSTGCGNVDVPGCSVGLCDEYRLIDTINAPRNGDNVVSFGVKFDLTVRGVCPTPMPTQSPTGFPTKAPTPSPSPKPTFSPVAPTAETPFPSVSPTDFPTLSPSDAPTFSPAFSPSLSPTETPLEFDETKAPTTGKPTTAEPTRSPTPRPTKSPSLSCVGESQQCAGDGWSRCCEDDLSCVQFTESDWYCRNERAVRPPSEAGSGIENDQSSDDGVVIYGVIGFVAIFALLALVFLILRKRNVVLKESGKPGLGQMNANDSLELSGMLQSRILEDPSVPAGVVSIANGKPTLSKHVPPPAKAGIDQDKLKEILNEDDGWKKME